MKEFIQKKIRSIVPMSDKNIITIMQILFGIVVGFLFFLSLGIFKYFEISRAIAEHSSFAPPPEAITAVKAEETLWNQTFTSPGSLAPVQGVTVSAENPGVVSKIHFANGATVKKGDILVSLDTALEEAQLRGAQARLYEAQRDFERSNKLKNSGAVSQGDFDASASKLRVAQSEVDTLTVTIAKKKIIAPFDGSTGARLVNEGEYLKEGSPVVPLQSLKKLYVNFSVPQSYIPIIKTRQKILVSVSEFLDKKYEGVIETINPEVTTSTRQVMVSGILDNTEESLKPGMFVSVEATIGEPKKTIAIPQSSISYAPYGDTVFVIENMKGPDGKEYLGAKSQVVSLGHKKGDMIEIVSGLAPGTLVASSGVFKLRPQAAVSVIDSVTPAQDLHPNPEDS